mmetsp:Transcript_34783/g.99309  ORF Transcript_34783/g.99309 Transcript_34783/m.99309 type:complete len:201 (-) Transcript_34783:890-1492(-)
MEKSWWKQPGWSEPSDSVRLDLASLHISDELHERSNTQVLGVGVSGLAARGPLQHQGREPHGPQLRPYQLPLRICVRVREPVLALQEARHRRHQRPAPPLHIVNPAALLHVEQAPNEGLVVGLVPVVGLTVEPAINRHDILHQETDNGVVLLNVPKNEWLLIPVLKLQRGLSNRPHEVPGCAWCVTLSNSPEVLEQHRGP